MVGRLCTCVMLLGLMWPGYAAVVLVGNVIEVPENQVSQETPPFISNGHSVAIFPDGRFVVVWNERENFVPLAKYRVFSASGLPETPATLFNEGLVIPVAPAVTIPADAQSKGPSPLFVTAGIVDDLTRVEVQSFGTGGGDADTVVFQSGIDNIDVTATITGGLRGTVIAGLLDQQVAFSSFSAKRSQAASTKRLVSASGDIAGTLVPTQDPFEFQPEIQRFDGDGFLGDPLVIPDPLAGFFNTDLAQCGDTAALLYVASNPGFTGIPNPVLALIDLGSDNSLSLRSATRDKLVPSAVAVSVTCNQLGQYVSAVGAPQPAGPFGRGEAQPGIVLRGFGSTGAPLGAVLIPRTAPTGGLATSISINSAGFGVVVWSDIQATQPSDQGVYAQLFQIQRSEVIFADGFESGTVDD